MRKFVLFGVITTCFALPAFATPSHTSATFPNDEYMLEDYTYTGQANYTNMGVYSDSVDADEYFSVSAGYYLPANTTTPAACTTGNFCTGLTGPVTLDANNAQGLTACSTLSGGYNSSAAGASAETDCYKACTTASVAHSATVTGNDYYGVRADTCAATTCESGYRVRPGFDLNEVIGTVGASGIGYINNKSWGSRLNNDVYNLPQPTTIATGAFAVEYNNNKGTVKGISQCSNYGGTGVYSNPAATSAGEVTARSSVNLGGNYCWCSFNEYISADGDSVSLTGPWVFLLYYSDMNECANECGRWCAESLESTSSSALMYRTAFLDSVHDICELNEYTVSAGEYLPAGSETVTQCPANSFCPGLTGPTYYDATNAQGATACSTLSGGYNSSDAGASANTDCYKACTTANVAHSATVTGNDYYGAGVDTCSATTCVAGYHTEAPDWNDLIGIGAATAIASIRSDGITYRAYTGDDTKYGVSGDPMAFAVDYGDDKGYFNGHGRCSTQGGTGPADTSTPSDITTTNNLTDETGTGRYCWCQLDSYTPSGGSAQTLSGPWVFEAGISNYGAAMCAERCADLCASRLQEVVTSSLVFRSAMLGAITTPAGPATCEANVITLNWSDVDPEYAGDNDEGTVTFGGDIRTPRAAVSKPGKTFVGWKFVKPSGN